MSNAAQEEEEAMKLPFPKRFAHQMWKVRVSAVEELIKVWKITMGDEEFIKYSPKLKELLNDANVVVQERALDALIIFVDKAEVAKKNIIPLIPGCIKSFFCCKSSRKSQNSTSIITYDGNRFSHNSYA